jgi:hypothetical protein
MVERLLDHVQQLGGLLIGFHVDGDTVVRAGGAHLYLVVGRVIGGFAAGSDGLADQDAILVQGHSDLLA